jgi:hypothetical protein
MVLLSSSSVLVLLSLRKTKQCGHDCFTHNICGNITVQISVSHLSSSDILEKAPTHNPYKILLASKTFLCKAVFHTDESKEQIGINESFV